MVTFLPSTTNNSQTQIKDLKVNAVLKKHNYVSRLVKPYTNDTSDHFPFFPGLSTEDKIHQFKRNHRSDQSYTRYHTK